MRRRSARRAAAATVAGLTLALAPSGPLAAPADAGAPDRARSVYELRLAVDGAITAAATAAALLPEVFASKLVDRRCPCDPREVNGFDRPAVDRASGVADGIGNVALGLALAAPVALDVWALGASSALAEDLGVFAETLAVNAALTNGVKYAVGRPSPRVYAARTPEDLRARRGYQSFYSGHTSFAFAALGAASMTAGYRYGAWVAPWHVTGVVGGGIGATRVLSGHHFPSDVIVGALAGSAVGIGVPWLHRRTRRGGAALALFPRLGGGGALGVEVGGRL